MTREYIRTLYAYNRWANHRIVGSAAELDAEQFIRDLASSYRSVRDTLRHILMAEWLWLMRWHGSSPMQSELPDFDKFATLDAIVDRWGEVEAEYELFIDTLTDARLRENLSYRNTRGEPFTQPLWHQMCHVPNHSSYHRGQITTMVRQLGATPAVTDFIVFLRN